MQTQSEDADKRKLCDQVTASTCQSVQFWLVIGLPASFPLKDRVSSRKSVLEVVG